MLALARSFSGIRTDLLRLALALEALSYFLIVSQMKSKCKLLRARIVVSSA